MLPELVQPNLTPKQKFAKWATAESYVRAKQVAYRNGNLQGSTNENNGTVLPSNYIDGAKPVAERRAVLAGYRIADLLKVLFPSP